MGVGDAAAVVASFPDVEIAIEAERESAFDVLDCLFERDIWGWSEQKVCVVGHDNKGVELETIFRALVLKDLDE